MDAQLTSVCPLCNRPVKLAEREFRVRRGDRVLPVQLPTWECTSGCLNEARTGPFRFGDQRLIRLERARLEAAWLTAFGEPLPPVTPPGPKPAERRSVPVHVMLTPSELRLLDRLRGERSRSEFIRGKALAS